MSDSHCQIAVVGLGAIGAMSLWQASRRSSSVIGIDQYAPGHGWGSSHGGSRIFRRTVFEGPAYIPLAARADELWDELDAQAESPLRIRTGGLSIGTAGGDLITDAQTAAAAGGIEVETLDADQLRRRYPQHAIFDDDVAVFEPGAGVIRPEAAIHTAVDHAATASATIHVGSPVTAITQQSTGVTITTTAGTIHAERVIVAAGAWTTALLPEAGLPIRVQRTVPVWFAAKPATASGADAFGPERFPVFIRESGALGGWGIPDVDGRGVKIGISGHAKPWLAAIADNRTPAGEADIAPVTAFARAAFTGLDDRVPSAVPCMNAKTPDDEFIIGTCPGTPDVIVLAGFGGHGFKHATAVGQIAAELATGETPSIPIAAFAPGRFGPDPWPGPPHLVFAPGHP